MAVSTVPNKQCHKSVTPAQPRCYQSVTDQGAEGEHGGEHGAEQTVSQKCTACSATVLQKCH
jgi:hypothetical protein